MPFFVYILYSESIDKYYVGQTENVQKRIEYHNSLEFNRIWTKRGIPWGIVKTIPFTSRKEAIKAEKFIKKQKSI